MVRTTICGVGEGSLKPGNWLSFQRASAATRKNCNTCTDKVIRSEALGWADFLFGAEVGAEVGSERESGRVNWQSGSGSSLV